MSILTFNLKQLYIIPCGYLGSQNFGHISVTYFCKPIRAKVLRIKRPKNNNELLHGLKKMDRCLSLSHATNFT